jgi:8-oxo-dGTP pyrophosphatase MutT (NUDIX family)
MRMRTARPSRNCPICLPVLRTNDQRRATIAVKRRRRRQYAAVPWCMGEDGRVLVLLITSRETRRWVVPKGWAEPGVKPREQAALEAFEEAGLEGVIGPGRLGSYRYDKQLRSGRAVPVRVDVYPLEVERRHDDWPERGQREMIWVTPEAAASLVEERGLAAILLDLAERRLPAASAGAGAVRPTA